METCKKILAKLLFPPVVIVVILVPISAFLLLKTFAFGFENDIMSYVSYFLSAYALTILCARTPSIVKNVGRIRRENKYIVRYRTDVHLQMELSLYASLAINILYALLQMVSGFYYQSTWFYALAGYYVLLAVVRFFLLRDTRHMEFGKDRLAEFRRYRFCGIILLLVNLALGVIVTYIVWLNRGFEHNEILTIAMAAYTFFTMTKAVINVLKYRRHESPVILAAKSISLTAALVSILSLETSMLTAFGTDDSPLFHQIMTGATGGVICLLVLSMAVYMIVRGTKEIRLLTKGMQENGAGE